MHFNETLIAFFGWLNASRTCTCHFWPEIDLLIVVNPVCFFPSQLLLIALFRIYENTITSHSKQVFHLDIANSDACTYLPNEVFLFQHAHLRTINLVLFFDISESIWNKTNLSKKYIHSRLMPSRGNSIEFIKFTVNFLFSGKKYFDENPQPKNDVRRIFSAINLE